MGRLLVGLLALLLGLAGCQPPPEPALRVGTNVWQGYEPLYLARDLGYFGEHRVRLVEYTSATQLLQAFRNGAVQGATVTLDETLPLALDGHDFAIVLVLDASAGADALVARPGIASLGELAGRRVGFENTALGAYMVTRALQQADLDPRDITPVTVRVDEHVRAYREDRVDALVTFEPARSRLREMGAVELFNSADIPNEVLDVLVVRRTALAQAAPQLQALMDGWFQALAYIEREPAAAAARMAPRLGIGPGEVTATFQDLALMDREDNAALLSGPSPRLVTIGRNLQRIMLTNGLLEDPVDFPRLVDPAPLEGLAP
jgi:NitT/TauT family transport system substrate-binding protein